MEDARTEKVNKESKETRHNEAQPEAEAAKKPEDILQELRDDTAPAALILFSEHADVEKRVKIFVDKQKMNAYMNIKRNKPDITITRDWLTEYIAKNKIALSNVLLENLTRVIEEVNKREEMIERIPIARGKPVVDGKDGYIDWKVNYSDKLEFKEREDGSIDYKQLNLIVNVQKGEQILQIMPPVEGKAGIDIMGNDVQPKQGKPVKVTKGKNVRASDDGKAFFATMDGRVVFKQKTVSIEQLFEVRGDVDLSVGNIDFNGSVRIYHNVCDGFTVRAQGVIEVLGLVEAANLTSEEDILVAGGINGKGKSLVQAKGRVIAKYLNEVKVEAACDVMVEKEIINSEVKTLAGVKADRAVVKGAHITASESVNIASIGSIAGIKARVTTGLDFIVADQIKKIESERNELTAQADRINRKISPLLADPEKLMSLDYDKIDATRKLQLQIKRIDEHLERLMEELTCLRGKFKRIKDSEIIINKLLLPGVVLQIRTSKYLSNEAIQGPMKFTLDIIGGEATPELKMMGVR